MIACQIPIKGRLYQVRFVSVIRVDGRLFRSFRDDIDRELIFRSDLTPEQLAEELATLGGVLPAFGSNRCSRSLQ